MFNAVADTWPMAVRQLDVFLASSEVANRKLGEIDGRLPDGFTDWWLRSWTSGLMFRSHRAVEDAAGVRAWYDFGRKLDRVFHVSAIDADSPHPRDAEFTYYDRPLLVDGGGGSRSLPFATHGLRSESYGRFRPVPFPRSPATPPNLAPRLACAEFFVWAGFLASPDPLTPRQVEELGHVGYSASGTNGWCEVTGTHGEQCGVLGERLVNRLREAIRRASDVLGISVETLPRDGRLDDALDCVSRWLERARTAQPEPAAMLPPTEIRPGQSAATEIEHGTAPEPPRQMPVWDGTTRTLMAGGETKVARRNGSSIASILDCFQRSGWPDGRVLICGAASAGDRAKCISKFLEDMPIVIRPDGTGDGMIWSWKTPE